MKGINKAACRSYLEPLTPPNPDCGLFLIKKLKFIVRTTIKNIGHRRMLVLCLYARGNTPGGKPVLAFTMFQASDSFITFDHSPNAKSPWRTAMLGNLDSSYHFIPDECAFYSGPDEKRAFEFCRPYVSGVNNDNGFDALDDLQKMIRGQETRRRQRNRELAVRRRMKTLHSLPKDTENWIVQRVVPAYFFYL